MHYKVQRAELRGHDSQNNQHEEERPIIAEYCVVHEMYFLYLPKYI